jgi:hypothetical protein
MCQRRQFCDGSFALGVARAEGARASDEAVANIFTQVTSARGATPIGGS